MDNVILEVKELSAAFYGTPVLNNVSFTVEKCSLVALIGANGCGKTTVLRSIINQIRHSGSSYLKGQRIEEMSLKKLSGLISYIPQKGGISISMPVIDVVLMGFNPRLKMLQMPSDAQRVMAVSALEQLGLAGCENSDFQELSAGQKQLVMLARTLIEDSLLLLLDEPDSALDFHNRYTIMNEIKSIVTEDKAALMCLHDPQLALEFCDQLVLIKDGRVIKNIFPMQTAVNEMESALREIYGPLTLSLVKDRGGKEHFTLLWENEI